MSNLSPGDVLRLIQNFGTITEAINKAIDLLTQLTQALAELNTFATNLQDLLPSLSNPTLTASTSTPPVDNPAPPSTAKPSKEVTPS